MSDSLDSLLEKALSGSGVRSAQDALVVALHACLLSGGFVCVAVGDEVYMPVKILASYPVPRPAFRRLQYGKAAESWAWDWERGYQNAWSVVTAKFDEEHTKTLAVLSSPDSPALPAGWNGLQDVYSLQYRHVKSHQPCLVKVIPLGGQLLVNALAACRSDEVYSVTLDVSKFVKNTSATEYLQSSFTNLLQLVTTLNKEIEAKLAQTCEKCRGGVAAGGRKERDPLREDPLRVGPPRQPRVPYRDPDPLAEPGPFGLGEGDRLPFGAGGGGMIFDPLRQGGRHGGFPGPGPMGPLPPHHPPGARFDPVSPFGPGAYPLPSRQPRGGGGGRGRWTQEPDPDHLPPPGYDDMFS